MVMLILMVFLIAVGIAAFGTWLFALVEAASAEFENSTEKILWILLIILLPVVGTILYLVIGRKNRLEGNTADYRQPYVEDELV